MAVDAGIREDTGDRSTSNCGAKPDFHILAPDGVEFERHHRMLDPVKVIKASAWRLQKIVGCCDELDRFVIEQLCGPREFMQLLCGWLTGFSDREGSAEEVGNNVDLFCGMRWIVCRACD